MLYLERRLWAGEDARAVIVVPMNVVTNWIAELQSWLQHYASETVRRVKDNLHIVRSLCKAAVCGHRVGCLPCAGCT